MKDANVREITCPHCRFKGEPLVEKQKGQVKKICPVCGNTVTFRRKR